MSLLLLCMCSCSTKLVGGCCECVRGWHTSLHLLTALPWHCEPWTGSIVGLCAPVHEDDSGGGESTLDVAAEHAKWATVFPSLADAEALDEEPLRLAVADEAGTCITYCSSPCS